MSQDKGEICIHTDTMIKGFFGEYRWLSNFYEASVVFEENTFLSSEAAYQSAKTTDEYAKSLFTKMTPSQSKKYGNEIKSIREWDKIKLNVMYAVVKDKFTRHEFLKKKLIETGEKHLEELNDWGDTFWGTCNGKGKNHLGLILMKIRKELQFIEGITFQDKKIRIEEDKKIFIDECKTRLENCILEIKLEDSIKNCTEILKNFTISFNEFLKDNQ